MAGHVEFAVDDAQNLAVRTDHEAGAFAGQWAESFDAKEFGDLSIGVREKRETEVVLFVEGLLPIHRIGADPYALGTEF